jgi:hypothetical protein
MFHSSPELLGNKTIYDLKPFDKPTYSTVSGGRQVVPSASSSSSLSDALLK